MGKTPFYGRKTELDRLNKQNQKKTSAMVVIKGRRRIGKTRLILEFSQGQKSLIFTGLPPEKGKTTAQDQREYFAKQMEQLLHLRGIKADDWADLFWHLAKETSKGQTLIVFDEINWMGTEDHTFLGKLKSAWDLYFKNNPQLILVLSGSMSAWIEDNILNSTGFVGRISLNLTLDELPLHVCNLFWRKKTKQISAYEKFKVLSVTGGVPLYLEKIDPNLSAEENIQEIAFTADGLLVEEFERIFSDLFSNRSERYKMIMKKLAEGSADLDAICKAAKMEKGGTVSHYLEELVGTGYIIRDYTWLIKTGKESLLSKFRLKDNYIRFYLKYIEPNHQKIKKGRVVTPPAWSSIMGLQFENLVLNNAKLVTHTLGIDPSDIINDGPYFQRQTKSSQGCQIDYLIQCKYNTLFVIEIKFSAEKIGMKIIKEVQERVKRLNKPKGHSVRPVLIHVNGVTDAVVESDYFSKIIDFSEFLG